MAAKADDSFKHTFLREIVCILIQILLIKIVYDQTDY